ncbi:MAG: 6-carboxytetrahydropterin synthase [Planctomycetes bacterium]|nr:6-carboxytetrahydropterin synthase [Planctomycetota bacterium]
MFSITAETTFKARHYLHLKPAPPEPPHQHLWRTQACVQLNTLDQNQTVMDFHQLQKHLKTAITPLSNSKHINDLPEFTQKNASTELIAQYIYKNLLPLLPQTVTLKHVTVWETNQNQATYQTNNHQK